MSSLCFKWISKFWKKLIIKLTVRYVVARPIPDDVITEILIKLPADQLPKCRRVCRQWKALTSTPSFVETNLHRDSPIVVLECFKFRGYNVMDVFFIDKAAKKRVKKACLRFSELDASTGPPVLINSCNGFLLFMAWLPMSTFFIRHPLMQYEMTLSTPNGRPYGSVVVLFFCSWAKEYRLLYVYNTGSSYCYIIGSLELMGTSGPSIYNWRRLCPFPYCPEYPIAPQIIDGFIFWMAKRGDVNIVPSCKESIITFNIRTEELHAMPHPGVICSSRSEHYMMQLLQAEGQLSFCGFDRNKLTIWVLEDCTEWIWLKKYQVELELDLKHYPFREVVLFGNYHDILVVSIKNEELLLFWSYRGLFQYHLRLKTVRKIEISGLRLRDFSAFDLRLTAYTKTFDSVRILEQHRKNSHGSQLGLNISF